jgi:hypothetical protein
MKAPQAWSGSPAPDGAEDVEHVQVIVSGGKHARMSCVMTDSVVNAAQAPACRAGPRCNHCRKRVVGFYEARRKRSPWRSSD